MIDGGFGYRGNPLFDNDGGVDDAFDLSAVGEYAAKVGNRMVGTRAERLALVSTAGVENRMWNGLEFEQLDGADKGTWRVVDGNWRRIAAIVEHQSAGSGGPSPFNVPTGDIDYFPLFKTGRMRSFTTSDFGNGYLPLVTFRTPFPNACTAVVVNHAQVSGGPSAPTSFAFDNVTAAGFRAFYPNQSTSTDRAYTWFAMGY